MIPATAPGVTALPDVGEMRCADGMTGSDGTEHRDPHDLNEGAGEKASVDAPPSDGLGDDGTIPDDPEGIAAGHTGTASTFEPEEDELAEDESADEP